MEIDDEFGYLGKLRIDRDCSQFSLDGRYLITFGHNNGINIHDLFHNTRRRIRVKFPKFTTKGKSLKPRRGYWIQGAFPLTLNTLIVHFAEDNLYAYLGILDIDYERASGVVQQAIPLYFAGHSNWIPRSVPPKLEGGLILQMWFGSEEHHFDIRLRSDGQLEAEESAIDYDIIFRYFNGFNRTKWKTRIHTLDLESLEWRRTTIELNDAVQTLHNDGENRLIVVLQNDKVYRFSFTRSEKLSDIVWLKLRRIFDTNSSAYDYIISQLPKNFKPQCGFPPLLSVAEVDENREQHEQLDPSNA
ncbi:hypothetical protein M3Y95_00338800 [Aphelenchoides besseyi]|nr:hypothetical protein M3Y95_00338800 [Aphelenchoides besseyi]